MKKLLIVFLFLSQYVVAQETAETSLVKWLDIETAQKLAKTNPKPLMIDVYTDWCGWCKHMMATTFSNQYIANYINTNFYPVRLNAESNDTIMYNDSTYYSTLQGNKYIQNLAYSLLDGRLSYPSIVYVDVSGEKYVIPGYQDVRKEEPIMYYFAEKINRSTPFDYYQRMFMYTFPEAYKEQLTQLNPAQTFDTTAVVHWLTIQEAFKKQAQNPKKIYIDIYAPGVVSNSIMARTNYKNPVIAKILNDEYYPVHFDATSKDTIVLGTTTYVNRGVHPFHDLAVQFAVADNKMILPTMVFIDEKGSAITRLQEYLNSVSMESFLEFIKQDKYKGQNWQDFEKTFKHQLTY
jgi:thioredoxin-related protein